jgi:acyl dehydratase
MTEPLHLEDLAVGQRFVSPTKIVTVEEITGFARAFDPQPFHVSEESAHATLFGGLAASGWHTAAMTMRLLVDGGPKIAGGLVGLGGEIAWPRPTRPGDTLRVETEILEIRPSRSKPDRGMVKMLSRTLNQKDEPVQTLTATIVVPRRNAAAG